MDKRDARKLSPAAQEDLRLRVVRAVDGGMTQVRAAEVFGVSRAAVNGWCQRSREGGQAALRGKKRGRPARPRLALKQAERVVRTILTRCPDQLRLPFALWTREAVQQLLASRFGLQVSVWTVGRYLKSWGLTPQKPLRRAYEQNPEAVGRWLRTEYPAIRQRAYDEGAEIHWGDEMGLRSDHQVGTSYGLRGKTPVVPGTGQRFRCNVISTITNRGKLAFMVFGQRFTAPVFIEFLERLLRHRKERKVFVIVDRHPVHRAARVHRWIQRRRDRLELFLLPPYSPELNPDELLNQDVKSNALGRRRPSDVTEMVTTVRGYLRSTQKRPHLVRNYFRHPQARYAALPQVSTENCSR
jgi:transposase